ncbi:ZIP family metal transporter [Paenibacillus turpanensis]|uniref:ZIP family metal transporter n=1 Tax=Paenibacillus turpanensis TaxID=2689078 RepID=UPI00140840C9|nr:ZIP family metal transporter [Paenibacillus turpanensis]
MYDMLMGGVASSLATGLGALPVFFFKTVSHRWKDILLAFTAGVMVAASTYGLIPSALKLSNMLVLTIGVLLGTLVLTLLEKIVPHVDPEHNSEGQQRLLEQNGFGVELGGKALLFLAAMTLHNIPEGLSVGVGYSSSDETLGPIVAISMGLQNAPEGFLTALFLVTQGVKRWPAFLFAFITGVLELLSCIVGYHLTAFVSGLIPYGLAFAGGAMLFIVYKELIPESHGHGHERPATFGFILGLLLMIGLSEWLG